MRRIALLILVVGLVVATAAEASPMYTKAPTNACLVRHHILLTQHSLIFTSGLGMPVMSVESFQFDGIPAGVVDQGALLFAPNAAAAKRAAKLYLDYYVREDFIKRHETRKTVASALSAEDHVIGNVFVQWDNYPQTRAATKIVRACLR